MPQISVLLPAYNAEKYLAESVQSILTQTYTDFELLLLDDGSTDRTPTIAADLAKTDPRIRVITNPRNLGLSRTLNLGIAQSKADLIARMDADDISLPTRFAKQVEYLQTHHHIGVVGGNREFITADGNSTLQPTKCKPNPQLADLLRENKLAHPTVMFRKSLVQQVGGYDTLFHHSQDYELWCRLAKITNLANLPDCLVKYRLHAESMGEKNLSTNWILLLYIRLLHRGKIDPKDHTRLQASPANVQDFLAKKHPLEYHTELARLHKREKRHAEALMHYRKLFALGKRDWKVIRNILRLRIRLSIKRAF